MYPAAPDNAGSNPPLSRRERKAIASRQAMFAAGLAAFERQPIGLVSVLDITEAADIAKGVFYLHFASKDDYLLALLSHVQNLFLGHVAGAVHGVRSNRQRIATVLREHATFAKERPAAARFRVRMSSYFNDEISGPGQLEKIRNEYIQQLADIIGVGIRSAATLDALCWSISVAHTHYRLSMLDESMVSKLVNCVVQSTAETTG